VVLQYKVGVWLRAKNRDQHCHMVYMAPEGLFGIMPNATEMRTLKKMIINRKYKKQSFQPVVIWM